MSDSCYTSTVLEQEEYDVMRVAATITLSDSAKKTLAKHTRSRSVSVRLAERSHIVLLSAAGMENKVIAQKLKIPPTKSVSGEIDSSRVAWQQSVTINPEGPIMAGKIPESRPGFGKGLLQPRRRRNPTTRRIGPHGHWLPPCIRRTALFIVCGSRLA